MVQVIENRADIEGRLLALRNDEMRPGHMVATIEVRTVEPVESFPNLMAEAAGKTLEVVMPVAVAGSHQSGVSVRCRVRRTGPAGVFAESCTQAG